MKRIVCLVMTIMLTFSIVGCNSKKAEDSKKDSTSIEDVKDEKDEDKVKVLKEELSDTTYEGFEKVTVGESYDEIVTVLGEPNKLVKSGEESTYIWEGENNKAISIVIKEDVVVTKSQSNLREGDSNVTIDQYNQLKDGMTIEEVEAILGTGKLTFEEKTDSFVRKIYSYYNEDNSCIIVNFRDDKLYSTTKNNLD